MFWQRAQRVCFVSNGPQLRMSHHNPVLILIDVRAVWYLHNALLRPHPIRRGHELQLILHR